MPYFRKKRLQSRITTGRWSLPIAIFIALIGWSACYVLLPEGRVQPMGLLFYALIGYLLVILNNTYALIRMRASVQTSVYLLLTAACPVLHVWWKADLVAVAFLLSLYFLFRSYQQQRPEGNLFHAFLFLGLGSFSLPELTWLSLLLWMGAYRFHSLGVKSFLASVLGWALPYALLGAYAYATNDVELFYRPLYELTTFEPCFVSFEPWLIATGGYALLLFIVASVHCISAGHEDKLCTRNFLGFLVATCFCLFAWLVLQPDKGVQLMALLLPCLSILGGHYFILTHSRLSNIFFILVFLLLLPLFLFNLWTLL